MKALLLVILLAVTLIFYGQWSALVILWGLSALGAAGWGGGVPARSAPAGRYGFSKRWSRMVVWGLAWLLVGLTVWRYQHLQGVDRGSLASVGVQRVVVQWQGLPRSTEGRWSQQGRVLQGRAAGTVWWFELDDRAAPALHDEVQASQPGDRCTLLVRARPVYAPANPGSFDREKWLLSEGIAAQGQILQASCQAVLSPDGRSRVDRVRLRLREHFVGFKSPARGVLLGLLTGDRALLTPELRHRYQQMGISHLLAISGPHVLWLAAWVTTLWTLLLNRWPRLYLRQERLRWQLPVMVLAVFGYALLAGWEVPAARTAWMTGLAALLLWKRQAHSPLRVLLWVAVAMVVAQPAVVWSAGFWLSFAALGVLLLWSATQQPEPVPPRWTSRLRTALVTLWRSQWAMTLYLLPITLLIFGKFSVVGWAVNLLAIPLLGIVVLSLNLLGLLCWGVSARGADLLWQLALQVLEVFHAALDGLAAVLDGSGQGSALLWPVSLTPVGLVCGFALVGLWLLPRGLCSRLWSVPLVLLMVSDRPLPQRQVQLTVLDVPQSQGLVVQTARHALLLDGGSPSRADAADQGRTAQILQALGVRRLDRLSLSRTDPQWSGDAQMLMSQLPPTLLWSGSRWPVGRKLPERTVEQPCVAGQQWLWDGVEFETLAPFAQAWADVEDEDRACVWRITVPATGGQPAQRVLVLGAAGMLTQQVLMLLCADFKADVLISGGQPILPELLQQSGARHWLRMQSPAAYARQQHGPWHASRQDSVPADDTLWQPALQGAITVNMGRVGIKVEGRRQRWPWLLYPVELESSRNPFSGAPLP